MKSKKSKNKKMPLKIKKELEKLTKEWLTNRKKSKKNINRFIKSLKKKCKQKRKSKI